MKQKQFLILAAIAFIALLGALMLNNQRAPQSLESGSARAFTGLEDDLNAISQVKITIAGNAVIATLNKTDTGWVVAEKGNYPADVAKVREMLLALGNAKVLEAKTAQKDLYSKLGVEDVADAAAGGVLVELSGGKTPLRLIVGQQSSQGTAGTFVRRADQAQSQLVSGTINVPKVAAEWLKKQVLDLQASNIVSASVIRPDATLTVSKAKREDQNFIVQNLPPKREVSSEFVANGLAGFVGTLNFDDVSARAADFAPPASAFKLDTQTFDGRVYSATLWEADGKQQMVISARFDDALAQANKPADPTAPAADADAAAKTAHQAAVAKAASDFTASLDSARKAVTAFNAEVGNWVYTIPSFKFAQANKTMADMLKQPEAAAPAAQ
jgi:Domain of unknown function (DUF4340)